MVTSYSNPSCAYTTFQVDGQILLDITLVELNTKVKGKRNTYTTTLL